jgi:hypothetical protein
LSPYRVSDHFRFDSAISAVGHGRGLHMRTGDEAGVTRTSVQETREKGSGEELVAEGRGRHLPGRMSCRRGCSRDVGGQPMACDAVGEAPLVGVETAGRAPG